MKTGAIDIANASLLAGKPTGGPVVTDESFAIIRRLKTPIWIYDIDNSRIVFANKTACTLWQAEDEAELCARDLRQDMSAMVRKRLKQYQFDFAERDASFNELWTLYPNGTPTSVMVVYTGIRLADGRMGMHCEVVDHKDDAPENLRSAEALLHTDVMITLYSIDGALLYMNPAARNAAMSSQHLFADIFLSSADHLEVMQALLGHGEHRIVARVCTGAGARWHDISVKRCNDAVTGEPAALVTAIDVTELKIARDKARYLADRDQLTGCYNRAFLLNHIENLSKGGVGKCALLYFDVDKFKQINDALGHEMGDVVLKQLAVRARKMIRGDDMIARLGGDEFVLLLRDVADLEGLKDRVALLRQAFSEPINHATTHVNVTVSAGVSIFEPQEADFTTILSNADIALYISKQNGRDRVTYFDDNIGTAVKERRQIEADIKRGIEKGEFIVHYQPRVDLQTESIVSAEALVRWNHPENGLIMPDRFIPICEETGMIEALGQWVLDVGCQQAITWAQQGLDTEVSINISPRQFQNDELLDALRHYAKKPGFPRKKIELEITENVLIGDHETIAQKLHEIVALGYRIAIDDFGTGYSNLSYISRFPLNCIKIDKSFISGLPDTGPIIRLILTLAKQINAISVAEGVETRAEYDWLVESGCDQIQGYYLSRPVPIDAFFQSGTSPDQITG